MKKIYALSTIAVLVFFESQSTFAASAWKSLVVTKAENSQRAVASSDVDAIISSSWATQNKGETLILDLNPLQTYRLQGRAGQDIHRPDPIKGKKIRVAVIDTGVDHTHPTLAGQITTNEKECAALAKYQKCSAENGRAGCHDLLVTGKNDVDTDGNGYPADCHGWSLMAEPTSQNIIGTPDFEDSIGHGTHVAGIIASVSKNIEIIPVQALTEAPNSPLKLFSFDLSPNEDKRGGFSGDPSLADRISRAIIYAIHAKADVINLSIGWPQGADAEIMREAIAEAQKRGIIIVAAAGNDSTSALLRPCQYEGVICVAAHRPDGALAHFSNFGYGVDIAAPGVSIVSTLPTNFRSIRVPGYVGVDILSGTSQAAPFVAGAAAELLARGVPAKEVYARLILGARPIVQELPLLVGPIMTAGEPVVTKASYSKSVLSGLLDIQNSLQVSPQPLILNADKEVHSILWDRKSANLKFSFALKNFWQPIKGQSVKVDVISANKLKIFPAVVKTEIMGDTTSWGAGDKKTVNVYLRIQDVIDASKSRLPSDLSYTVNVYIDNKLHRTFEERAEVIVELTENSVGGDLVSMPLKGQLGQGMKMFIVDEVYDAQSTQRDYFAMTQEEKAFSIALVRANGKSYQVETVQSIPFNGEIRLTRPQSRIRLDIDGDGRSEYVLGLLEFKDVEGFINGTGDYTMHLYIFNDQMVLQKHIPFYDRRVLMPLDFNWIKVGGGLRPAWVAQGEKVVKKWNVTDLWQVDPKEIPGSREQDIRFYYLDENYTLTQIDTAPGVRIVDVIQPSVAQVQAGVLPVLVARNLGTEIKPSYLNAFSIGWVQNAVLTQERALENMSATQNYRNLIDTRKDKVHNLTSGSSDEFRGTFWFNFDAHQKQRVTMIDFKSNRMYDRLISSQRNVFDTPFRVRSAYLGEKHQGVFLITNSEIEFHEFATNTVGTTSLNRYTFFGDDLIVDLQQPITIANQAGNEMSPALFTTEGSGINRGVKVLVPILDDSGVQAMVSPARLHVKATKGCRALDSAAFIGDKEGYALDYYCGDKILRLKLKY